MFNEVNNLVSPKQLEYKLFDKKKNRKVDLSNVHKQKEDNEKNDFVLNIREMMFPIFYPFKVKNIKKINDVYEIFLSTPDCFSYTDDHFQLINNSLLTETNEFEEIKNLLKAKEVKSFDDFMPIKINNSSFYFEIFFYNMYYKNWIHLFKKLITSAVS